MGGGSFWMDGPSGACAKTPSAQIQRRTADRASENVTTDLPGQATPPTRRPRGSDGVEHRHDRVQPEQARDGPQDRRLAPPSRRLDVEFGTRLLEGGLDVPAAGVGLDDPPHVERRVGRVEVLVAVRAVAVADEGPADRDQALALLVPVAGAGGRLDAARPAAVPGDRHPPPSGRRLDGLARLRQPRPLDPRTPQAAVGRAAARRGWPRGGSCSPGVSRPRWRSANRASSCVP